jgi:translation initiation factor IF-3
VETEEALSMAEESGLDLVEVGPRERPPVCRIMDFGKYKYQKKKKQTQSTHATKTKEIRLRPKTGQHDIDFKVRKARDFLEHRDKVQISVIFRGREMAHIDEGEKVMNRVIAELDEFGKVESPPSRQGRRITCMIVPK